jgi:polar amino acid transport system substrate-binding protein
LNERKINVRNLITHSFDIKDAISAYNIITDKSRDDYTGILLKYPDRSGKLIPNVETRRIFETHSSLKIGFIGAGAFAKSKLLPYLEAAKVDLIGISTESAINAKTAAKRFGFKYSTTDSLAIINDPDVNVIFCATRHDSHSKYVVESLKNNKHIFVEKPLAVNRKQLYEIDEALTASRGNLMVGFNRRFSEAFTRISDFFSKRNQPMLISYRVNAGVLPEGHWVYRDDNKGRLIGEVCHFIDIMVYLTKSLPVSVFAECISGVSTAVHNHDNLAITLKFADGSLGNIIYTTLCDKMLPKEYCEVHCEGSSAILDNFKKLQLRSVIKEHSYKLDGNKGHKEEVIAFINAIKTGKEMPISYNELYSVTLATFATVESLSQGNAIRLI